MASRLVEVIGHNVRLLESNRFHEVDLDFEKQDLKQASPEIMLANLRSTFAARTLLRAWYPYLDRVKSELEQRGLDATRLLHGMNELRRSA